MEDASNNQYVTSCTTNVTSCVVKTLSPGHTYIITVRVVTAKGNGFAQMITYQVPGTFRHESVGQMAFVGPGLRMIDHVETGAQPFDKRLQCTL